MLRKKSVAFLEKTLRKVVRNDDYIESDEGSSAIAAAEVVARAKGHFGQRDAYTAKLDAWISSGDLTFSPEVEELALKALEQVTSGQSEVREVWEDAGADTLREWRLPIARRRPAHKTSLRNYSKPAFAVRPDGRRPDRA
jgi:hypothetical protein